MKTMKASAMDKLKAKMAAWREKHGVPEPTKKRRASKCPGCKTTLGTDGVIFAKGKGYHKECLPKGQR